MILWACQRARHVKLALLREDIRPGAAVGATALALGRTTCLIVNRVFDVALGSQVHRDVLGAAFRIGPAAVVIAIKILIGAGSQLHVANRHDTARSVATAEPAASADEKKRYK